MNKKGFTLIELLAVIVILSIISVIAVPNVMQIQENRKRTLYLVDAKTFATAASYMYTQSNYVEDSNFFIKEDNNTYLIKLKNIISIDTEKDPFGFNYDKENSYIRFKDPDPNNGFETRKVSIYIKSCDLNDSTNCHCIAGDANHLDESLVDGSCLSGE